MREVRFRLRISPDDLLAYYRGIARTVLAVSDEGLRVQFPADALRPFITKDGLDGRFALSFDDDNRFAGIRRLT